MTEENILPEFEGLSSNPIAQWTAKSKSIVEQSGVFSEKEDSCHSGGIASDGVSAMGDDGSAKNYGGWKKNGWRALLLQKIRM